jgi:adenylate kinase family enzyme
VSILPRVVVVGTSCSGKTTFARRLADRCAIPHIELDELHWRPNWEAQPIEVFRRSVRAAAAESDWVIDGNYSKVRELVWPRATDIVWLNLPFRVVFWRALSRTGRRVISREELFAGNRESLWRALFDPESIPWWVIRTYHRRRREYAALLLKPTDLPFTVHEVQNMLQQQALLRSLCAGSD